MIDPRSLSEIAHRMAATGIELLEVHSGPLRYRLLADPAHDQVLGAPPPPPPRPPDAFAIATGIGRLRLSHPQRGRREVAHGGAVRQGQVLAYLAAGPLLQPVLAPCDGVLGAALAQEDALLGYGDKVFAIRPG